MLLPFLILMLVGSLFIPTEHAIANQTVTVHNLYLPHVDEEMDQYHFWVIDQQSNKVLMTFCEKQGLKPPWDERQTLTYVTFRVQPDCLELIAYDGIRYTEGSNKDKIINFRR